MRLGKSGEAYFIRNKGETQHKMMGEKLTEIHDDVVNNMNIEQQDIEGNQEDQLDCNVEDDMEDIYKGIKLFEDAPKSKADS